MNKESQNNEVGEVINHVPGMWPASVCAWGSSRGGMQSDEAFISAL